MSDQYIEVIKDADGIVREVKHLAEPGYRPVFFTITALAILVGLCILHIQ